MIDFSPDERPRMPDSVPKFYQSDLPAKPEDMKRVRRALHRGPLVRKALIEAAGLTQTRAMCAVDALIARGDVCYDSATREFSLPA